MFRQWQSTGMRDCPLLVHNRKAGAYYRAGNANYLVSLNWIDSIRKQLLVKLLRNVFGFGCLPLAKQV